MTLPAPLAGRKAAGHDDLDPSHLPLTLFAMSSAPNVLPHVIRLIFDTDPDSPEFG